MVDLTRKAMLGLLGAGALGTALSWPRLTGQDIPGRGSDALTIAILGTAQDAAARQGLIAAFRKEHPDIPVRVQAIQGQDWSNYFAKILTMVAAGTPPDVVSVATEGAQLFASRLAYPLDEYVRRDAGVMREYFEDVHPALVESFMYRGSLYQLPMDFNAANLYYNTQAFERAGVGRPRDDWDTDDFLRTARALNRSASGSFLPFFWTNRLWGGVVPWLYANDTSFLTEEKSPGGRWLWSDFYPDERSRGGGYLWEHANATADRTVETFELLEQMVRDGLAASPAQGGGNELVARFAQGVIGMTPAGGYWAEGLREGGMTADQFDVSFFPKMRSQRAQFGASGYAIMRTSERKDAAWEWIKFCASRTGMALTTPAPNTTPARRSMLTDSFYAESGPKHWRVFYDTLDRFPDSAPIPAPPQQAAVETALIKNVVSTITRGTRGVRPGLDLMQRDLELALRSR